MQQYQLTIPEIRHGLRSEDGATRARVLHALWLRVNKDPGSHAAALDIFRTLLQAPRDALLATSAIDGLAAIGRADEARQAALALLADPRPEIVAAVVLGIRDPAYVAPLIELLSRREEPRVREATLRSLGRLRDPAALPSMLGCLAVPELRPHVVEALADLGDPRAIASLEPLLQDRTDAWPEDNHGPMLRVCDLAAAAIERLRREPADPARAR